jgi:hypothetical protein
MKLGFGRDMADALPNAQHRSKERFVMKKSISIALLVALTGCGAPNIAVKEKWTESIANFSFVPLYPMREDVFVGDIRIHRLDANKGAGLYSRYVRRLSVDVEEKEAASPVYAATGAARPELTGDTVSWNLPEGDTPIFAAHMPLPKDKTPTPKRLRLMALPSLAAVRITSADVSGGGPLGALNLLFSGSFEDEENVLVSLKGLETVEISDIGVAARFEEEVKKMLRTPTELKALCVAAKAMGDPGFEKSAISLVTRVAYARGMEYAYGDNFKGALSASAGLPAKDTEGKGNFSNETTKSLNLNEIFDRPMAFGVDAIMIDPKKLRTGLASTCAKEADAFMTTPLSEAMTGAPKRGTDS